MSNQIQELPEQELAISGAGSNPPLGKLLVVDDEPELRSVLVESLQRHGYEVTGCGSGRQALAELRERDFDLLLTDLMMPEMDGIALLKAALEIDPHLVGIVVTGQGTIQTAVDAMQIGAFDYVLKPFRLQNLLPVLTRALNTRQLRLENLQLRETVAIHELTQTISFTLDPQTVMSKLTEAALQQTGADEVSVLLPTSDGKEFYVAAARGAQTDRLLGERIPFDRSIASWVARERTPLILNGEVNDDRFVALWPRPAIRSSVSVPMVVANKLVGVLNLNVINRHRPFALGQMKALSILAGTAAAALENASLHTQIRTIEEKYRSIFENANEGLFQTTYDGQLLTANPALAQILGYDSPEEMIATITDIAHQLYVNPEDRAEAGRLQEERGTLEGFEMEALRKDGEKIWLSLNRRSVRNQNWEALYFEGSIENITERKLAEHALRESEERYRLLFESNPQPMWVYDLETLAFLAVNESAVHHYGYSREDFLAMTIKDIRPAEDTPALYDSVARSSEGVGVAGIWKHLKKDGAIIEVEITSHLLVFDGRRANLILAHDITERNRLEAALLVSEEQLRQSQKLEAIGQLAGGVAHDFNNLLTVIGGYSSILLGKLAEDSAQRASLEEIKKASDRAGRLTRQLLAFSRKQILQPKVLDLNLVVTDLETMVRRLIGEDIDLLTITSPVLGKVKADPGQIEQVLLNLIVNARDAMPKGGKLTIETRNVVHSEEYAQRHAALAGPYVMLAVSDTGCGMDAAIRPLIFDPFFTTKASGKGTGLGLSTVYGIVKQSGGNIWVYSEAGRGSAFKIYLPRVDEAGEVEAAVASSSAPQGTELILLVEDEDQVRAILTRILEGRGYHVLSASNGEEALLIAQDLERDIKLMITDVVMPQMSGRELAERVLAIRPSLPVLFMSGYTDDAIVRHGLLDETLNFIQKPFDSTTVARKVREVLDKPA